MALSRVKVWIAGEVLTASDLNAEFNNILNNPVSLISPFTAALDLDGYTLTLDAAGVTTIISSGSQAYQFTPGAKAGTPSTTGSVQNFVASTFTDTATAASGTVTNFVAHAFQRPTLAATNASVTATNAASVYIANAPAAGTNQTITNAYALWVDDGISRLDGGLIADGVTALNIGMPTNCRLVATVGSNALTIALKGNDGNDPSVSNPVRVPFRNATIATGDVAWLTVTAATSLVISSGSTLGTISGEISRLWVVAFNDGGTFRLGAVNCYLNPGIAYIESSVIASSTAEGGAGGADTAGVIYTGSAVSAKAMTILGYVESTQATAGTWATSPSTIRPWVSGMRLPGQVVQQRRTINVAASTGSTGIPNDDTTPLSSEGDIFISQAITPTSTANVLKITIDVSGAVSAGNHWSYGIFRTGDAAWLKAAKYNLANNDILTQHHMQYQYRAPTVSSTTFNLMAGGNSGTFTINGQSGGRIYGGTIESYIDVEEVMA